jgi:hypothetical protein
LDVTEGGGGFVRLRGEGVLVFEPGIVGGGLEFL